jgi:MoxR-like ATPase
MLTAKVKALTNDRFAVGIDDIRAVALPVLRHRIVTNFHAQTSTRRPTTSTPMRWSSRRCVRSSIHTPRPDRHQSYQFCPSCLVAISTSQSWKALIS